MKDLIGLKASVINMHSTAQHRGVRVSVRADTRHMQERQHQQPAPTAQTQPPESPAAAGAVGGGVSQLPSSSVQFDSSKGLGPTGDLSDAAAADDVDVETGMPADTALHGPTPSKESAMTAAAAVGSQGAGATSSQEEQHTVHIQQLDGSGDEQHDSPSSTDDLQAALSAGVYISPELGIDIAHDMMRDLQLSSLPVIATLPAAWPTAHSSSQQGLHGVADSSDSSDAGSSSDSTAYQSCGSCAATDSSTSSSSGDVAKGRSRAQGSSSSSLRQRGLLNAANTAASAAQQQQQDSRQQLLADSADGGLHGRTSGTHLHTHTHGRFKCVSHFWT